MKKIPKISYFLIVAISFLFAGRALADSVFNPDYIIGDQEILDSSTMSVADIQNFLTVRNSYLANYSCTDPNGLLMSAAQAIWDRATTNRVNPKFLLVLLQKEQGLIEDATPAQKNLDWATGYGCPDSGGCNERWRGLWKQINSAALQFRDYMDNPQDYTYKASQTYNISNTNKPDMTVTPVNQATAALYNYTPHVYNGNYNFWKLWQRYFTRSYTNGSLLQVSGDDTVYLIENNQKRAIVSRGALVSRFDPKKIITVAKADIDKYPDGTPIKFPQYSLVRLPTGAIYLLVDNNKRGFSSMDAFRKNGFNLDEVVDADWEDLMAYGEGAPIGATSTYATGALLTSKKGGPVYYVVNDTKAPLIDPVFLKTKFKGQKVIKVDPKALNKYAAIAPITFPDGDLIKGATSTAVYLIDSQILRPFTSGDDFLKLGYKWENIIKAPAKVLNLYPVGDPIIVTN